MLHLDLQFFIETRYIYIQFCFRKNDYASPLSIIINNVILFISIISPLLCRSPAVSAMSLLRIASLVVVMVALSAAAPQPTISFATLGGHKDQLISSLAGIKGTLLAPVIGLKKGLVGAAAGIARPIVDLKKGLLGAKLGLVGGLAGAKLGLAKTVLRPVAGIKAAKLSAVRGVLDAKINALNGF